MGKGFGLIGRGFRKDLIMVVGRCRFIKGKQVPLFIRHFLTFFFDRCPSSERKLYSQVQALEPVPNTFLFSYAASPSVISIQ